MPEHARRRPRRGVVLVALATTVVLIGATIAFRGSSESEPAGPSRAGDRFVPSEYLVRRGDTIASVAEVHALSPEALMDEIGLDVDDSLTPGDRLAIAQPDDVEDPPSSLSTDPIKPGYETLFATAARTHDVPQTLLEALAWRASEWTNTMVADDGSAGLGQLSPDTVEWLNREIVDTPLDPDVPADSAQLIGAYLAHLLEENGGDQAAAIASFRDGLREPRDPIWDLGVVRYVSRVFELLPQFRGEISPPTTTTTSTSLAPATTLGE